MLSFDAVSVVLTGGACFLVDCVLRKARAWCEGIECAVLCCTE